MYDVYRMQAAKGLSLGFDTLNAYLAPVPFLQHSNAVIRNFIHSILDLCS